MKNKKQIISIICIAIFSIIISQAFIRFSKKDEAPEIDFRSLLLIDEAQVPVDNSEFKNKTTLICFYASWCGDCRKELKTINEVKDKLLNDVSIVLITDDTPEKIKEFKMKNKYKFKVLKLQDQTLKELGIKFIPTLYVLNKQVETTFSKVGYINWANTDEVTSILKTAE